MIIGTNPELCHCGPNLISSRTYNRKSPIYRKVSVCNKAKNHEFKDQAYDSAESGSLK